MHDTTRSLGSRRCDRCGEWTMYEPNVGWVHCAAGADHDARPVVAGASS